HVKYDAAKLTASAIAGAVADTGMRAWLEHEEPVAVSERSMRIRQGAVVVSGLALGAGLLASALGAGRWTADGLFALSFALAVPLTLRKAWTAMRIASLDINVL